MYDLATRLKSLKRPGLLMQAANHGASDYRRNKHLARAMQGQPPAKNGEIIFRLLDMEDEINRLRRDGDAAYSPARHVQIMIALVAEAQTTLFGQCKAAVIPAKTKLPLPTV